MSMVKRSPRQSTRFVMPGHRTSARTQPDQDAAGRDAAGRDAVSGDAVSGDAVGRGRLLLSLLLIAAPAAAQTAQARLDRLLAPGQLPGALQRSAIGVTRQQTIIPALLTADDLDYGTSKTRVLLVGGLDGAAAPVENTLAALRWFYDAAEAKALRQRFAVSAVPAANPEGWAGNTGSSNGAGGDPTRGYPPTGDAYSSPTDPEAAYLWRWIGMHAPDLVVDVRSAAGGEKPRWLVPDGGSPALHQLAAKIGQTAALPVSGELASALARAAPSDVGTIPALMVEAAAGSSFLPQLLQAAEAAEFRRPSPARREIQTRLDRAPLDVARQLSQHYGHSLERVEYIHALALVGRMRVGELTGDASHLLDVERIVGPFARGEKPSLGEKPNGSEFAGHLVFAELATASATGSGSGNEAYIDRVRRVAELGFDDQGRPLEVMPAHSEMSDAVFMSGPILAEAGRLTGESKYYDMALRHLRFMLKLNLRPDGLHRHSPLDPTAWGRGNGFPALGLALSLSALPEDHAARPEILAALRAHLEALLPHQDATGMWRQVIDFPGSYRELTVTSMLTFVMARGMRLGWLEESRYRPAAERAWYALRARIAPNGGLVDVCTGTGKQESLRAYLDRTAILGPDPRGGAMALLAATELALLERR
jgi:rhamnogalacturonyl hydrolase YesR